MARNLKWKLQSMCSYVTQKTGQFNKRSSIENRNQKLLKETEKRVENGMCQISLYTDYLSELLEKEGYMVESTRIQKAMK